MNVVYINIYIIYMYFFLWTSTKDARKVRKVKLSIHLSVRGFWWLSHVGQNFWMLMAPRQRAFILIHEGTFGNQEGMITWYWLVISCLATKHYYCWDLLLIKFFCNNGFPFSWSHEDFIKELKHNSKNKNTKWSTLYCTKH